MLSEPARLVSSASAGRTFLHAVLAGSMLLLAVYALAWQHALSYKVPTGLLLKSPSKPGVLLFKSQSAS